MRFLKDIIKRVVFSFITHPSEYIANSYSQAGEDAIIRTLFDSKKINNPTYLDLGVYLPDYHNNTYLFYKLGARGVLVEADESLISRIKQVRPKDKVLNIGVGFMDSSSSDFYIFNEPAISTFNKEEALYRESHGTFKIVKISQVLLKSINSIITENFETCPDLLSIDLEGLDLAVLESLNFEKFPIPVICAETCRYSENHIKSKNTMIIDWLISKGYFVYGDTYINTIFVNNKWFTTTTP